MNADFPIPTFVINLAEDIGRYEAILAQFQALPEFAIRIIRGIHGKSLSDNACTILAKSARWVSFKGTLGCFMSHVKAWEEVSRNSAPFAVVLEDDVDASELIRLRNLAVPSDAEIIFLSERMSPNRSALAALEAMPLSNLLTHLDKLRVGLGGDGYLLTPSAAKKLLDACLVDSYFGHVDGRLLRYATSEHDLAALPADSWIGQVIKNHHHPTILPKLGLLRGYCLSRPLVRHRGVSSSREAGDNNSVGEVISSPALAQEHFDSERNRSPQNPTMLPIRYWNRIRNAGDLINPYVVEHVSERRPYYCMDEKVEHVLCIGSILFMASAHSHIWGSGALDPNANYSKIDVSKVHAVRGKLTEKILREKYGLSKEIALGDPGIFVDELPEVLRFLKEKKTRRRVAFIPHYAMADNERIKRVARNLDADILDPRTASLDFLKDILESEIVVSQSLHGLIFAEMFGKPSVWISHDSGSVWTFKFHDWFSNTIEPPTAPLTLDAAPTAIIAAARLSGISVDKEALRRAFPKIPSGGRTAGYGFRECRSRSPLLVRVVSESHLPADDNFDATFNCLSGDEETLRKLIAALGRQFDDPIPFFLIFDTEIYDGMTAGEIRNCLNLLSILPVAHYFAFIPSEFRIPGQNYTSGRLNTDKIEVDNWNPAFSWRGAVLVRNPASFSFSAPGYAVFRTI